MVKIVEGWREIIRLAKSFSGEGLKEVASNLPGFLLDAAGLKTVEGDGLFDFNRGDRQTSVQAAGAGVTVGNINMDINGGGDPETTALTIRERLSQTFDNLRGNVDQ